MSWITPSFSTSAFFIQDTLTEGPSGGWRASRVNTPSHLYFFQLLVPLPRKPQLIATFFPTRRTSAHLLRPPHCRVPGVWACHVPRQAWCPLELCKPVLLFWRHISPPPASAHTAHGLTSACLAVGLSARIRRLAQACSPLRAPYPVCTQQEFRSDHRGAPSSPRPTSVAQNLTLYILVVTRSMLPPLYSLGASQSSGNKIPESAGPTGRPFFIRTAGDRFVRLKWRLSPLRKEIGSGWIGSG